MPVQAAAAKILRCRMAATADIWIVIDEKYVPSNASAGRSKKRVHVLDHGVAVDCSGVAMSAIKRTWLTPG